MFGFTLPLIAVRRVPLQSIVSVHAAPSSVYTVPKGRVTVLLPERVIIGAMVSTLNGRVVVGLVFPKASVSVTDAL